MINKRVHIIRRGNGWVIRKEGAQRALRFYDEKSVAKKAAQRYRSEGYDVIVHTIDGTVDQWQKAKTS